MRAFAVASTAIDSPALAAALSLALEFDPSELTDDDRLAIDAEFGGRIKDWAMPLRETLIDGEIARLEAIRAALDHDGIARDRAGATDRALFDPFRAAALGHWSPSTRRSRRW